MGRLKASTLIEVVTASVIFLIVLTASLSILARLPVGEEESRALIEADSVFALTLDELSDGAHPDGDYDASHLWGEINATLQPYDDYPDLQQLTLTATITNSHKRIHRSYVIERQ